MVSDTTSNPIDQGQAAGGDSWQVLTDARATVDRLNSDGDRTVFSLTAEAKVAGVPAGPIEKLGVGGKVQYGYDINVTQRGDSQTAGQVDDGHVTYEVSFSKRLLAGPQVEPRVPYVDPVLELNLSSADQVTMTFETRAEAARAVDILQRTAIAEAARDGINLAVGTASAPLLIGGLGLPSGVRPSTASNPVLDDAPGLRPELPTPGDLIATGLQPDATERAFIQNHITSYSTTLGSQLRPKLVASLGNLGIEPRLDLNQRLTRTVQLPQDGKPGQVTYTLAGEFDPSTKEKFTIGAKHFDFLEKGYTPQNIVDHGTVRGEISLSYTLPADAAKPSVSGRPLPELGGDLDLANPDQLRAEFTVEWQAQSPTDLSRTDLRRRSLQVEIDQPVRQSAALVNRIIDGDAAGAFRDQGPGRRVTADDVTINRQGSQTQHEIGAEIADAEAKVSLIADLGYDDVVRSKAAPAPSEHQPITPPAQPPLPQDQLVVVPRSGLNVRAAGTADADRVGVFLHGTFVQPTGQRATDAAGQSWVEVRGPDAGDLEVQGWVAADYVRLHPEGAMDLTGRINPRLADAGYQTDIAVPGDNLWDLAKAHGVDFDGMVELNRDHLIDPSLIFPGDTVYIPGTAQPQAAVPPAAVPPADPAPAPSNSQPSGSSGPGVPRSPDLPSGPSMPAAPTSSAPSGVPPAAAPGDSAPLPPTREPASTGRPHPEAIQSSYQVAEDRIVDWRPDFRLLGIGLPGFVLDHAPGVDLTPKRMTATEAALLDQLSLDQQRHMKTLHDRAFAEASRQYLVGDLVQRESLPAGAAGDQQFQQALVWARNWGHNDAFRHVYWSAAMTREFGPEFAEAFTTAHEGLPGNAADEEAMDLYNNELGRRIAAAHPDATEAELASYVRAAIDQGEALVIDGTGHLSWSDQVAYGEHGRPDDAPIGGQIRPRGDVQPRTAS